jgi:hypothetical protein
MVAVLKYCAIVVATQKQIVVNESSAKALDLDSNRISHLGHHRSLNTASVAD